MFWLRRTCRGHLSVFTSTLPAGAAKTSSQCQPEFENAPIALPTSPEVQSWSSQGNREDGEGSKTIGSGPHTCRFDRHVVGRIFMLFIMGAFRLQSYFTNPRGVRENSDSTRFVLATRVRIAGAVSPTKFVRLNLTRKREFTKGTTLPIHNRSSHANLTSRLIRRSYKAGCRDVPPSPSLAGQGFVRPANSFGKGSEFRYRSPIKQRRIKPNLSGAPLSVYLMTGTLTGLSGNRILLMSRSKTRAVAS